MGAFAASSPSLPLFSAYCPWCNKTVYGRTSFDSKQIEQHKQHFRQHMYEDLQKHKVGILEVRKQQQRQLQRYLEGLLPPRDDLPLDKAS